MAESLRLTWSPDTEGQWHKIIALTRWGNEGPWTVHTGCHRMLSENDLGEGSRLEPPTEGRCRSYDWTDEHGAEL